MHSQRWKPGSSCTGCAGGCEAGGAAAHAKGWAEGAAQLVPPACWLDCWGLPGCWGAASMLLGV